MSDKNIRLTAGAVNWQRPCLYVSDTDPSIYPTEQRIICLCHASLNVQFLLGDFSPRTCGAARRYQRNRPKSMVTSREVPVGLAFTASSPCLSVSHVIFLVLTSPLLNQMRRKHLEATNHCRSTWLSWVWVMVKIHDEHLPAILGFTWLR